MQELLERYKAKLQDLETEYQKLLQKERETRKQADTFMNSYYKECLTRNALHMEFCNQLVCDIQAIKPKTA